MAPNLSRDVPLVPDQAALLFIDVQNYCAVRNGGEYKDLSPAAFEETLGYDFDCLEATAIPNLQRLQAGFRAAGIEVMYTHIESLTKDGRDLSLDYKISGFSVPKGCWDAQIIDAIIAFDSDATL